MNKEKNTKLKNIIFICIGDSHIVGDSLGPLIGSIILSNKESIEKTYNLKISVIGSIFEPLTYGNIETKLLEFYKNFNQVCNNKKEKTTIIIIDSALGSKQNIGSVAISSKYINAGAGMNRGQLLQGDIAIKGVVAELFDNIAQSREALNSVSLNQIEALAKKIINIIYEILYIEKEENKKEKYGNNFYIDNI